MRFSIITPTYKRAGLLTRAVASIQAQTYKDWELIIVNDSPKDNTYSSFASSINDPRIHYHVNDTNSGVNFSRNKALDKVSAVSEWIIFLDDDDYLAPDALATFKELIETHPESAWLITNRAQTDGTPLTEIKKSDNSYSYIWDYLILKRCKGDVTHCIETDRVHTIRFSKYIKNGEEWIFFYELGLREKMFYHDHNSTITGGYDESGLNFRKRTRGELFESLSTLVYEASVRGYVYRPTFLLYSFIRFLRIII
jgi:glycosyltransferase involved in cell wall biosynthesis